MITKQKLIEWSACADGAEWFNAAFPEGTDLQTAIDRAVADSHDDWGYWLFQQCQTEGLYPEIIVHGYRNSGNGNSGYWNSGYRNSGDWNSGDRNSGDWNSGDRNSGFFNSTKPREVRIFNKMCLADQWEAAYKPRFLQFSITQWADESEMTEQQKIDDPYFYVRCGQLQTLQYKEAFMASWAAADPADRERIKDLPNFDADIFFQISGIRV